MKIFLLFFSLFFTTSFIWGQKELPQFGEVNISDLQLTHCSFEPEASAMKLFDVQVTEFERGRFETTLKTERRVRLKIFNNKGYKYSSIQIPYLNKKGIAKIKELKAIIYNIDSNGKIFMQKLEKKDFYKEKAIEYIGLVNFTFPNLKPGSILEYKYKTVETNLVHIDPWTIQDEIPVLYTSKTIIGPVESQLFERVFGVDTLEQKIEFLGGGKFKKTTFFKEKIKSFNPEPFVSSVKDHLIRASFLFFPLGAAYYISNMGSPDKLWNTFGSQLMNSKFFEEEVRKPIKGPEKIIDSAKKINSVEDRIGFIFNEVKKRFIIKAEQTKNADSLSQAWQNREGTSAEINFILLNVLDKSDIKCLPLLISTKENGKVNTIFPSLDQLNGVDVVAFDSTKVYILDASIKHQSYTTPPLNILNREALILSPDTAQWVTITDKRPLFKQIKFISGDLTSEGKVEGYSTIQYFDYAKKDKLDSTNKSLSESKDNYLDNRLENINIISTKIETREDNDFEPLLETIDFVYEPLNTGKFYFISPQILNERNNNPFIAPQRETEIDLGCNQNYTVSMEIRFSDSCFEVEYLPKTITVRAPDSSFFYKISYSTAKNNVYVTQQFEVKRDMFLKEEYPSLQEFYRKMYAIMSEEIIFKKKY